MGAVGIESFMRIYQYRQFFILDLHQFGSVGGRIWILRNHEGYFLRLEEHLAGCQHHLLIKEESGHPGEIRLGQVLAGDHRQNARKLHRRS